jgi:hypothetical protein
LQFFARFSGQKRTESLTWTDLHETSVKRLRVTSIRFDDAQIVTFKCERYEREGSGADKPETIRFAGLHRNRSKSTRAI